MSEPEKEEKEDDSHPYRRPKDAATLILVDRSGSVPKVLVGKRHDKVIFMPGKFVFPGGRVDATDNRVPVAADIPKALEKKLTGGSPKIAPARARALAVAAIREACEETGLCLGRQVARMNGAAAKLTGEWRPFADAGLLPDPSGLFLIARAITPPGRSGGSTHGFLPPTHRRSRTGLKASSMPMPNLLSLCGSSLVRCLSRIFIK